MRKFLSGSVTTDLPYTFFLPIYLKISNSEPQVLILSRLHKDRDVEKLAITCI